MITPKDITVVIATWNLAKSRGVLRLRYCLESLANAGAGQIKVIDGSNKYGWQAMVKMIKTINAPVQLHHIGATARFNKCTQYNAALRLTQDNDSEFVK